MTSKSYNQQLNNIIRGIQKLNSEVQSLQKAQNLEKLFKNEINALQQQNVPMNGKSSKRPSTKKRGASSCSKKRMENPLIVSLQKLKVEKKKEYNKKKLEKMIKEFEKL